LKYIFSRNDINKEKIYVHGRSLGGAVGIYALRNSIYPVKGLIIENTFTNISDMIDKIFPLLKYIKKFV